MIVPDLDAETDGFLIRLSFLVYLLFERLMADLSEYSPVVKSQVDASRFLLGLQIPELDLYRYFVSQISVV